jgi:tRNA threonylcarbamoyladenosine biosynthesis protein TsaE
MPKAISTHVSQVKQLAKEIAAKLKGGEVFGLVGPLGAGKTTFTQELAKALGVKKTLRSPTFILMQSVSAKIKTAKGVKAVALYHLDLYRLDNKQAVKALGMNDFLGKPGTITLIEWADKAEGLLPKKTKFIHFLTEKTSL